LKANSTEISIGRICAINGLQITTRQKELLSKYVSLLLDWNKKLNLISRRDEENIWERHILHSISILFHFTIEERGRVLDLGTGGGLPGIPLKILMPELSLYLIDSIKKKIVAVENIVRSLSLQGVKVKCSRAEDLAKSEEFMGQFDYVIARGVAELHKLAAWSFPFLERRAMHTEDSMRGEKMFVSPPALIAMKGGNLQAEIPVAQRDKHVREVLVRHLRIRGLDETENPDRKAVVVYFQ
jgi:16S rRNA (guanine527-N7)-methyltransferase